MKVSRAVCLGLLLACGPNDSNPPRTSPEVPTQEIEDFSFTETRLGIARWTLHARSLSDYPSREQVVVGGVHVDFFAPDADSLVRTSTLSADSGEFRRSTQDMRVWGHVVVDNREGTRLLTGWLRWTQRTEMISTQDTVLVRRGEHTMRGAGLESDPELRNVRILRDVTGSLAGRP